MIMLSQSWYYDIRYHVHTIACKWTWRCWGTCRGRTSRKRSGWLVVWPHNWENFLTCSKKKSTFIYFWMTLNIWVRLEIYVNPEPFTFLIFSDFHSIFPGTSSNWWILNICCLNICSWCKDSVGVGMKQFQILYHTLHKVPAWCALQIVQSTSRSREHCTFCEMHKRGPDLARAAHSLQKSRRVCSSRLWWVLFVLGNDAMPWHTVACHGMAWWVLFVLGNSQCAAE